MSDKVIKESKKKDMGFTKEGRHYIVKCLSITPKNIISCYKRNFKHMIDAREYFSIIKCEVLKKEKDLQYFLHLYEVREDGEKLNHRINTNIPCGE